MQTLLQDLRFGLRMLFKNFGFSALGVLTLALGIGGNIVILSFFNSFYLRPFPFKEADCLVDLNETAPRWNLEYTSLSWRSFHWWRESNRSFESMGAWAPSSYNVSFGGEAERISGARVTHDLATVLGIQPVLGRPIGAEEDRPGGEKVVLIGQKLWHRAFGGANVLGQTLRLNSEPYTIIGVLPPDTALLDEAELWVPLCESPNSPNGWYLGGVGRLKAGVSLEQARADLKQLHAGLSQDKKVDENAFPRLTPLSERYFGATRPVLNVFLGAAGLVLLIACGNIGALMLARGMARSREIAVRLSLGATPWRIAQLIGVEALLMSALGGVLGICLGYWALRSTLVSFPTRIPAWVHFDFDWRMGLFAVLMVMAAACLGALPAIRQALKPSLQETLQSAPRQSTVTGSKRRSLNALVVGELAMTVILMVQAGLLVQAFRALQKADPGYRADHVLLYELSLLGAQYDTREKQTAFFEKHLEQVRSLPGVVSASAVSAPPLGSHWGGFFTIEGAPPKGPNEPDPVILQRFAFPGYFDTMGMKLLKGRGLNEQDGRNEGSLAVVVNELFAEQMWPSQDPIGKRIRYRGPNDPWITVVGVVQDVKHYGADRPMIPGVYLPYAQMPLQNMTLVVRSSVPPTSLVPTVRTVLRQADSELPMINVATMQERLTNSMWIRRLCSTIIGVFAGVAMIMAIGGIGGVFSYMVSRRTHELGIRLALGAQERDVLWLVLRQGMSLVVVGIGLGLIGALCTAPLLRSVLFGVSPVDPLTLLGISLLVTAVAMVACWLPARRAMTVEPMAALRSE